MSRAFELLRHAFTAPVDDRDPHSIDIEMLHELAATFDAALTAWFKLQIDGWENVPKGPALVVGNHNSGITFIEAIGMGARLYHTRGTDDLWHGLAHDSMMDMPGIGPVLVRLGAVRAGHDTAAKVFALGRKVVVFPGGNKEAFRPWTARNRAEFYGRTGFVKLAVRHQVPIVPMAFQGGHNGFVVLSRGERFAKITGLRKLLRTDAWPLYLGLPWGVAFGPWFHLPLPVKVKVRFLEPIPTAGVSLDDADAIAALGKQVEDAITAAIVTLAATA